MHTSPSVVQNLVNATFMCMDLQSFLEVPWSYINRVVSIWPSSLKFDSYSKGSSSPKLHYTKNEEIVNEKLSFLCSANDQSHSRPGVKLLLISRSQCNIPVDHNVVSMSIWRLSDVADGIWLLN